MDVDGFWELMETTKRSSQNDEHLHAMLLIEALEKHTEQDILDFDTIFWQFMDRADHWDLWGAAIIILWFCADSCFENFRAWLIGQGQIVYERALADPQSLAEILPIPEDGEVKAELEAMLFVSTTAYENVTGQLLIRESLPPCMTQGHPKTREDWLKLYPILAEKYWSSD